VTRLLVCANVCAYAGERSLSAAGAGLVPSRFLAAPASEAPTLASSMFLHDPSGWTHLAGNMLFLSVFGGLAEDRLGRRGALGVYAAAGLVAALGQTVVCPDSAASMIGASGAVSGMLGASVALAPRAPIRIFPWFELPVWIVAAEFFALNVLGALAGAGGGVAFAAHLAGFVGGLLLARLLT
jgi:membrane associated rhomboid family serine protease